MKRVFLFLATNIAVMVVLSIVTSVLGVDRFLMQNGINYQALLVFSLIFGFGGAKGSFFGDLKANAFDNPVCG